MIDAILNRLSHVKKSGRGWVSRCPAHHDGSPSLSITEGKKGVLMYCHAGCSITDVCNAIGMHPSDLFYERLKAFKTPEADLDDYIIAIARADLRAGKELTVEEQKLYVDAVRRKL